MHPLNFLYMHAAPGGVGVGGVGVWECVVRPCECVRLSSAKFVKICVRVTRLITFVIDVCACVYVVAFCIATRTHTDK